MKRFAVLLWTLMTLLPQPARTAPLVPKHQGYAFDKPRVLVQQRLFGLAHGVTLLASTCLADGAGTKGREAIFAAYAAWDKEQNPTIEEIQNSLAHYYFGDQISEVKWLDIASAIKLPLKLDLKPGSLEMIAACDSLPESLGKPRYDLNRQYHLQQMAARLAAATTTVAYAETCRASLSGEAANSLDEGMLHWREAYGQGVNDARATLEQQWDDAQLDGNLADWLAQAREKGQKAAGKNVAAETPATENTLSCATFSAWLLTEQADPDDQFKSRP